ncbi:acyl-CoA dehydrogenase family protein [Metabacillus fastidiosus]|uniref:acyl-CoA dehydrogenase family protein n=1 Tax=Metabacillus fastidiosus TaxID=1458 RepID=UPI003D2E8E12
MSYQKQLNVEENIKNQDSSSSSAFTAPVKLDSPDFNLLLNKIAQDAKERRNAGSETRPYYAIDLIRQARLGALRLPVELGGGGASIRDVFNVVIRLAEVDPDVAHSLRFHYYQVEISLLNRDTEQNKIWLEKVSEGEIIGNAFTEISSKNVGTLSFETTLSSEGDGYRLNGTKYFSTGTLYADWVVVLASTSDGKTASVSVPTNREGLIIEDDWDGIGQRLTGSGTTRLNNVFVNKEEVTFIHEDTTPFNSHLQLYLQAVIAGILRNVVTDASALLHGRSRSFTFAAADTPASDPQLLQIIGELSSSAFAAETIVLAAAEAQDKAIDSAVDGIINFSLSHEASLLAAQAKVIVDKLALQASTLLFEVGGASATKQSANLDRHWRNIRTLASHNPVVYKARAIGNYVVNDTELPIKSVYF